MLYAIRLQRQTLSLKVRRKAYRLLRRFLTPEQDAQLRRKREIPVTTASGRTYRLLPNTGAVHEVERHGSRYFVVRSFCLHPDDTVPLPPADVTLSQLLLLVADEEEFRRLANITERQSDLWNGEWLRTLRRVRLARAGGVLTDA